MKKLHVRRLIDNSIVKTIEVSNPTNLHKIIRGLLINMDTNHYYVDDSEFDDDFSTEKLMSMEANLEGEGNG